MCPKWPLNRLLANQFSLARLALVRVGVYRCRRVAFSMSVHCEVVEMRNSTDAVGYSCSRTASTQCFDRGSELCESHADLWRMPLGFLPALLSVASSAALEACSRGTSRTELPRQSDKKFSNLCIASTNHCNDFGCSGSSMMMGSLGELWPFPPKRN